MALTNTRLPNFAGLVPARGTYPIRANVQIFKGALVALDSAGRAMPAGLAAGGSVSVVGISSAHYDNRTGSELGGAAEAVKVEVEFGTFQFANSEGGDAIASDDVGKVAFVVDDQTAALTSDTDTRIILGFITEVRDGRPYIWLGPHVGGLIVIAAAEASQLDTAQTEIDQLQLAGNRTFAVHAPIPARAIDDTFELPLGVVAIAGAVTAADIVASDAVTGDTTNTASFILKRYRAGVAATIATLNLVTTTGDLVAFVPKDMGALTNTALLADDVLVLEATEGGDGLVTPAGSVSVRIASTLITA